MCPANAIVRNDASGPFDGNVLPGHCTSSRSRPAPSASLFGVPRLPRRFLHQRAGGLQIRDELLVALVRHAKIGVAVVDQHAHVLDQMRPEELRGRGRLLVLEPESSRGEVA